MNNNTSWGNIRYVYDYEGFILINMDNGDVTFKLTQTICYPDLDIVETREL